MKGVAQDINSRLKVDGLCRAFPERVTKLIEAEGDRISPYSAFLRTKCTGKVGISFGALCLIMRCKVVGQSLKRPQGEKLKKQREAEEKRQLAVLCTPENKKPQKNKIFLLAFGYCKMQGTWTKLQKTSGEQAFGRQRSCRGTSVSPNTKSNSQHKTMPSQSQPFIMK